MIVGVRRVIGHPSTVLLASTGATTVLGIVSASVQARVLGPSGRGELATAVVPGTLLAIILCLGLPDYVSRKAAQGHDTAELSRLALIASVVIGLVAFIPYAILSGLRVPVGSDSWWLLIAYACALPLYVYGYCLTGMSGGAGRWKSVALVRLAPSALSIVGILVLALAFPPATPLDVGLVMVTLTALCPLLYLATRRMLPVRRPPLVRFREAASFGLRGWPAGTVALINQRVDLLMMTAMATHADLGFYAVATTLAAVLNAVANSIAMPARNRVSRGDHSLVPAITAATMLIMLVLAAVVALLLPVLVQVLLGSKFIPAEPVMVILLFMQVPLGGVVVLTQSLIAAGHPGAPLAGEIVALVSTVALILAFFSVGGIEAAAVATGIGNVLSFIVLLWLAQRHLGRERLWRYIVITPTRALALARQR